VASRNDLLCSRCFIKSPGVTCEFFDVMNRTLQGKAVRGEIPQVDATEKGGGITSR
jgi:hypothetical protein